MLKVKVQSCWNLSKKPLKGSLPLWCSVPKKLKRQKFSHGGNDQVGEIVIQLILELTLGPSEEPEPHWKKEAVMDLLQLQVCNRTSGGRG